MKHIKLFEESNNNKLYWLLPTDSRFRKSLKDIGCTEYYIRNFIKNPMLLKTLLIPMGRLISLILPMSFLIVILL